MITVAEFAHEIALRARRKHVRMTQAQARELVDELFASALEHAIEHGRFYWPGFGSILVGSRKARKIKGPPGTEREGETIRLPRTREIRLRAATEVRAKLNARRASP